MTTTEADDADLNRRLSLMAAAVMLVPLLGGPAQAHPLYDTTRVLEQEGNACVGQKDCKVIASERQRIKAGKALSISAHCPDARPYFVSWDAGHHEHIGIRLVERRSGGLSVVAINHADAPGRVTLFIGCAKERHRRTVELQALEALPSKALKARRR